MRRALVLALMLLWPAAVSAMTLGPARVGFSAERVLVIGQHRYVGRMWQMPGLQRHEQELRAFRPVFILRRDSAVAELIVPQLHTFVAFALPPALALLQGQGLLQHPVGRERVDGVMTTRYAVDESAPEGRAAGSLWLSDDGIAVKCVGRYTAANGKVSRIRWELHNIRIGPQDPRLFEVPKGFTPLQPEAMAPLLGLRLAPSRGR